MFWFLCKIIVRLFALQSTLALNSWEGSICCLRGSYSFVHCLESEKGHGAFIVLGLFVGKKSCEKYVMLERRHRRFYEITLSFFSNIKKNNKKCYQISLSEVIFAVTSQNLSSGYML